jgi:cytoskeletal protein RodZ
VTGSSIGASSALVATEAKTDSGEPDAGRSGTLMLRLDEQTFANSGVQSGVVTTSADAGLQVHAQAAGSLTVAGTASAAAENGYIDPQSIGHAAGSVDRTASGSAALDRAVPRSILDVTVDARDKEQHALGDVKKQNAYTNDDALLSVDAFGHSAGAVRTDEIWQHDNTAKFASTESLF